MTRKVTLIVPQHKTESVVERIRALPGLLTLALQPKAGLQPRGDLITAELKEESLHNLMRYLDGQGLGQDSGYSLSTSDPQSIVSPTGLRATSVDSNEATWEEMATSIAKESNMTINSMVLMAIAGALAVAGIASGALHLVIAAMIIAPGFEPFTRIALGVVNRNNEWRWGLLQSFKGYGVLALGALVVTLLLSLETPPPAQGESPYLWPESLLTYWTTITLASVIVSLLGGIGGAIVISTSRSVLTAGAMVALALIPSAAIVGLGIGTGDYPLAMQGLSRWAVDVILVTGTSWVVLEIKRRHIQKRRMWA